MSVIDKAKEWAANHEESLTRALCLAVGLAPVVLTVVGKSRKAHREFKRDRMIYDPSMGFYWEIKHNLTNNQKMMIEQRRRNGETYGKILREMNLLKK